MNLLYVADFMIEPMAPRRSAGRESRGEGGHPMAKIFADYLDRHGEGWHSFELAVHDLPGALEDLSERHIRTSPGVPFTHPKDVFGFCIELVPDDLTFLPGDPAGYDGWQSTWFRGNPLTLDGLAGMVHTVTDVTQATDFLVQTWNAEPVVFDHVEKPEPLDRAYIRLAGVTLVLIKPTSDSGPVTDHIRARNNGIYSLAWRVTDLDRARAHLADLAVPMDDSTSVLGQMAVDPAFMLGARHEFVQA